MIRKLAGTVLILLGAAFIFEFGVLGTVGKAPDSAAPFVSLGTGYPGDAIRLLGGLWGLGLGIALLGRSSNPAWRPMSTFFLVNSLLLASSATAAFLGSRPDLGNDRAVAVFAVMALLQIGVGLLLGILAAFEKPRGVVGLALGGAVYLASTMMTLVAFFGGGA